MRGVATLNVKHVVANRIPCLNATIEIPHQKAKQTHCPMSDLISVTKESYIVKRDTFIQHFVRYISSWLELFYLLILLYRQEDSHFLCF